MESGDEEVRAQILSGIPRMSAAQRHELALYLASGSEERDLNVLVRTSPLLRERFAAFLHDNPDALEAIVPQQPPRKRFVPAIVAAAAVLLAVVPLAAQYQLQRGMVSGPVVASAPAQAWAPAKAVSAATLKPAVRHPINHHVAVVRPPAQHANLHRANANHPIVRPPAVAAMHRSAHRRVLHVAFANHPRKHKRRDPYEVRARSVVGAYLNGVIHGDVFDAPEAKIVDPMSNTHVLWARRTADGREKVAVTITGPHGKYYEVFYVARDSGHIVDHFYAPER